MNNTPSEKEKSGKHLCECSRKSCSENFEADTIPGLAKQVARHWNKEHSRQISHRYDTIETEVISKTRLNGNIHQIREKEIRVTSYDVIAANRSQPLTEEFALPSDPRCCIECWRYTGSSEVNSLALSDTRLGCQYKCEYCADITDDPDRPDYDKKEDKCHSLTDFKNQE